MYHLSFSTLTIINHNLRATSSIDAKSDALLANDDTSGVVTMTELIRIKNKREFPFKLISDDVIRIVCSETLNRYYQKILVESYYDDWQ